MSDILQMSQRELSRLELIQRVKRKELTQVRAAELLGISARQMKRLVRAYKATGAAGLVSKRRGRASNNRLAAHTIASASELLCTRYHDFGPTLAHEKLVEDHALKLSVESVRRLMIAQGLWQARRAHRRVIHQLRERRGRIGELVQIDGSPHDWFEGRGGEMHVACLHRRCERATSCSCGSLPPRQPSPTSRQSRHTSPGMVSRALSIATSTACFASVQPCTLPDSPTTGLTQFGRAMKELSIELICAHSPQAKGRVERANQTLQDRLVKELRLRGISNMEDANAYLPEFASDFNSRFAVAPRAGEDAHRPRAPAEDLSRILTLVEGRTLSKNLTLSYHRRHYQIETKRPSYTMRGAAVEVREASTGHITVEYQGKPLVCRLYSTQEQQPAPVTPAKLLNTTLDQGTQTPKPPRQPYHPSPTHPWRLDKLPRPSPPTEPYR